MLRLNVLLLLIVFQGQVLAKTIQSQIYGIDLGKNKEPHLIQLTDGQVVFLDYKKTKILDDIISKKHDKSWLEFKVDTTNELQSLKVIPPNVTNESFEALEDRQNNESETPYEPSIVSFTRASEIFKKMRLDYKKKSQCFNRAHIWTYEQFKRSRTYSNKIFLFFTSRYIRNYRFGWWFHVTPMLLVGGDKEVNWRMLDRRYTKGPLRAKTWTDIFIRSKRSCKVAKKYSEYRENQRSQDCYLISVPMYFLVPSDIERLESTGETRSAFDEIEVENAYWEAFAKDITIN